MACRRHSLNKPKNIKIAYILPTNRVTDQSPAPLSNVKSIKKPWKHWTERRQKSCVDYWLCRNRKSTIRTGLICLSTLRLSTVPRTTTTFRWLIMDSRMEMPCATPKCCLPCTMKHGYSFPITIAMTIAVSSRTASDGRKMESRWILACRPTTPRLLTNGFVT